MDLYVTACTRYLVKSKQSYKTLYIYNVFPSLSWLQIHSLDEHTGPGNDPSYITSPVCLPGSHRWPCSHDKHVLLFPDFAGPNYLCLSCHVIGFLETATPYSGTKHICLMLQHIYPILFLFPTRCSVLYTNSMHIIHCGSILSLTCGYRLSHLI